MPFNKCSVKCYLLFLGIDVETDLDAWIDRVCLDR